MVTFIPWHRQWFLLGRAFALLLCLGHAPASSPVLATDPYQRQRQQLVENHIRGAGISDPRVLKALQDTPRHEFVPAGQRMRAYFDMALPIGQSQTISSPFIVALMTEALDPQPTDKVLEIGTGSGYQAAVLSPLVAKVFTIEIVAPLGRRAETVLSRLNYDNVSVRIGDGFLGWPEEAPFDKIIVTCSPESIPQPLVDQLREGGMIIIPVGERYQQTLYRMIKQDGKLERQPLQPTLFVPMTGKAESERQQQPDLANPRLQNDNFLEAGSDDQTVPGWYYGRQVRRVAAADDEASSLATTASTDSDAFVRFENKTSGLNAHLLQGLPLDGRQVVTLRLSARIRTEDVVRGEGIDHLPAVAITCYDDQRREVATYTLGPFRGTTDWTEHGRLLRIPFQSREAIVRIGLFGATGVADFDFVEISPQ